MGLVSSLPLRYRFQGALVGLALVPTALRLSVMDTSTTDTSATCKKAASKKAARSVEQTVYIQSAAPGLLRYHHCFQQRRQWIDRVLFPHLPENDLKPVPLLVAGDRLEAILTGKSISVDNRRCRHSLSPAQDDYYQTLSRVLEKAAVPESYLMSVQNVAQNVAAEASHWKEEESKEESRSSHSSNELGNTPMLILTAIMGFLSGAEGGIGSLPVLHQTQQGQTQQGQTNARHTSDRQPERNGLQTAPISAIATRELAIELSDRTYRQWAGALI